MGLNNDGSNSHADIVSSNFSFFLIARFSQPASFAEIVDEKYSFLI